MPPKTKRNSEGSDEGPPSKKVQPPRDSDEYRKKRDRNNVAVKKSREKTRQKAKETMEKVNRLKKENEDLEMKVKVLSKELSLLKDLFLSHAGSVREGNCIQGGAEKAWSGLAPIKLETDHLGSNGESEDSNGSCIEEPTVFADPQAVPKDHAYSAPCAIIDTGNQ